MRKQNVDPINPNSMTWFLTAWDVFLKDREMVPPVMSWTPYFETWGGINTTERAPVLTHPMHRIHKGPGLCRPHRMLTWCLCYRQNRIFFCMSVLTRAPWSTGCLQVEFALLVKFLAFLHSYSENKEKQHVYKKSNRKRTVRPRYPGHVKFLIWLSVLSHPFILIKINHLTMFLPLGHWKTISTCMEMASVT